MSQAKGFEKFIQDEIDSDPQLLKAIEDEAFYYNIAEQIYKARNECNLTQQELADLVGTKQPVIARMEDANYYGHSISMLRRIADKLEKRLYIEFRSKFTDYSTCENGLSAQLDSLSWHNQPELGNRWAAEFKITYEAAAAA